MKKLSKLLSTIEYFYKLATELVDIKNDNNFAGYINEHGVWIDTDDDEENPESESEGFVANPHLGEYDNLIHVSNNIKNHFDWEHPLKVIAELYKKAIESGKGYNIIFNAINAFTNEALMEMEDPDEDIDFGDIEDALNATIKDLKSRAGGLELLKVRPDQKTIEDFKSAKKQIDSAMVEFEKQKMESGESSMYEDIATGDISQYDESAVSALDKADFISGDNGKKPGMRNINRAPKDWIEVYINDVKRYKNMLDVETSISVRKKLTDIIDVSTKLAKLTKELIDKDYGLESDQEVKNIKSNIKELKSIRKNLKDHVRLFMIKKNEKILQENKTSSTDDSEQFIIEEKIKLNNLLSSRDYNKEPEIKARKRLINFLNSFKAGFGKNPRPEDIALYYKEIDKAAAKKEDVSGKRKEEAKNRRSLKDSPTLKGYLEQFGEKINTQRSETRKKYVKIIKKEIAQEVIKEEYKTLLPYMSRLADAIASGNNTSIKDATSELNEAINEYAANLPIVKEVNNHLRKFDEFKKELKSVESSKVLEQEEIPDLIKNELFNLVERGESLVTAYKAQDLFGNIVEWNLKALNAIKERLN